MSSHIYFCHQASCSNTTTEHGSTCDTCRQDWSCCPDCGDTGATVLGSNYCHECFSKRNHPCNAPPAADGWCPKCDMYTVVLPNICDRCAHPCITCGCTAEFRDGERVCGCDTCKVNGCIYGDDEYLRDLAERFYLGNCYAETEEGYMAACRWYDGELGEIDEKTRASLLVTLRRWHSCSGDIDYERGIKVCDEDGHFPSSRCEEVADDWREMTGRCMNCDLFYNLICSSDRRDLCRKCQ